ncbi:MAG: serine/threonine protein kinase, partial [Myxococcales bacterium]|nr:serine/threonine protein kinase [Myxococcales bacterium]
MDLEPWSEGLLGRVLHGRYELLAPLAAGGMGVVFEARHRTLETRLAVKVLTPELRGSSRARARFVREARLAASVGGTGVVRVFDLGELEDAGPYLVMELLEGEPLAAWMERQGRVSPAAIGELVLPLLETLARLHRADLVHRDIKPSNVFLAREGEQTVVKLLDFGIA